MTPTELNEVARFWTEFRSDSPESQVIAGLQSALRASQAAVAQMREDAARVVMREAANYETAIQKAVGDPAQLDRWSDCRGELAELAAEIRALPAPGEVVAVSTFSPAPAVAPVENPHGCCKLDRCTMDANGVCDLAPVAAPNPGPTTYAQSECLRCGSRTPGMHDCKPPFDAEAALVAMEASIARRQYGPTPATRYEVYTAIQDALAAGRGARS